MKFRIVFLFTTISSFLFSQNKELDTLKQDSIPQHSVKRAVIYSSILPGAGQVYNYLNIEKGVKGKNNVFWKVPLIYAGVGAAGYFLVQNEFTQLSLKQEYNYRKENNGEISNQKYVYYDSLTLLSEHSRYLTKRDLSILVFGAAYLVQIIDAGIEAHFVKFDISDDLTLQIRPKLLNQNTVGIGLCFNFR